MLKILSEFFINRKLSTLQSFKKRLNIPENLKKPSRILILHNENLWTAKDVYGIRSTVQYNYPDSKVELAFFEFHQLYREIFNWPSHYLEIPAPGKFEQLALLNRLKADKEPVDMLFDLTTFDIRLRKMIIRSIKPAMSIATYEKNAEDDYNILFKNSKPDTLSLFRALNMEIKADSFVSGAQECLSRSKPGEFDIILIGSSRKVKNEMKKAFKEQKKFLLIENLSKQLDIFSLLSINKCKNVVCEDSLSREVSFIKHLELPKL